jgi:apolipoprotein N-acyltransferase
VQLEFPSTERVVAALDDIMAKHADVDVVVLSEYTFSSPPPEAVRAWCRRNGRFLVVGGTSPVAGDASNFQNTAFVIGPDGEIVFSQAKSVPIQFFRDGEPAATQQLWESPWGKVGICICYDLSFSRVTDELVRQGAELLIVPTMDVMHWGQRQHELHAMIAPSRAAEYGVPIVRVCSSGISQVVDPRGRVTASLTFPGQGETFVARVRLSSGASVPPDRLLAWVGIAVSAMLIVVLVVRECRLRSAKLRIS